MSKRLTFSERVYLLRRRRGMSQPELATILNVSIRTVQNVEERPGYERKLKLSTRARLEIMLKRLAEDEAQTKPKKAANMEVSA